MFAISGHRVYSSGSATNVHGFERLKAPLSDPARRCQHSVANGGLQQLNISVSAGWRVRPKALAARGPVMLSFHGTNFIVA